MEPKSAKKADSHDRLFVLPLYVEITHIKPISFDYPIFVFGRLTLVPKNQICRLRVDYLSLKYIREV
jgi:hypothetical protein